MIVAQTFRSLGKVELMLRWTCEGWSKFGFEVKGFRGVMQFEEKPIGRRSAEDIMSLLH